MRVRAGSKTTTSAVLAALALSLAHAQEADDARAVVRVASEAAPLTAEDNPEHRWALLIGVDAYDHDGIHDLRYAGNDVRAVAEQLISSGTYLPDHVVLMTTSPDASRPDLLPSRNNILLKLAWLRSLPEAQSLLFYFSGHGLAEEHKGERRNYLLPMDALDEDPISTGLDLDEVLRKLGAVRVRQRLVVLDACRNQLLEDGSRAMEQAWASRPLSLAEGTQVIFATSHGGRSYEDDTWKMGVFTHTFVEALKGAADGSGEGAADQLVTVREVFDYATSRLEVQGQKGRMQIPTMGGESTGDFMLVKLPGPPPPPPPPPRVDAPIGVVRVSGDASRVRVVRADGAESLSGSPLAPGTYTLRATFDGFQEGPAGTVEVLPGEEASVRCDARFVSCDVERYDRRAGE